mgnify:CR=1 FL=1
MTSLFQILMLLLNIVWFIIIAHVIMSWLINFQVLNLRGDVFFFNFRALRAGDDFFQISNLKKNESGR